MPEIYSTNNGAGTTPLVPSATEEDQARGNLYALIGVLLAGPPDQALLEILQEISTATDDDGELAPAWHAICLAAREADPDSLRDEYQELFIGLGRGEVVPYGSWYLTGYLMEQPLARLRGDLKDLQIERQPGVREPEDHAAALCDTMALLISDENAITLTRQHDFYANHIEPWMGKFFTDLQQAKSARFYRAVGMLGEKFLAVESQAYRLTIPSADTTTL